MATPRLRPDRARGLSSLAPTRYTEEVSSRVGPLRAGLGGLARMAGAGIGALGSIGPEGSLARGLGDMIPNPVRARRERQVAEQENELADMFAGDPALLRLARIDPQTALSEHLTQTRTAADRTYQEGIRTQDRGYQVEDREDNQTFQAGQGVEDFNRQVELARIKAELDRQAATSQLTQKPFEAYVGGQLRQIMPQGGGLFTDYVTGQAVDPTQITFEQAVDPKTTLESMSPEGRTRVLFSGPNAIEAAHTMTEQYGGGYSPNQDWGAAAVRDAPIPGGDALARVWGGQDYQQAEQSWKQFEAGMLPILSGAAVTDSEAKRVLLAMKPSVGDGPEVIARKVAAINRMSAIAEQAIGGQPVTDLNSIVEMQPFLAQARTSQDAGDLSIDDLVSRYAP